MRLMIFALLLVAAPTGAVAQDMIYTTRFGDDASLNGKPIWIGAARCSAFEPVFADLEITERRRILAEARRKYPNSASEYQDDPAWELRVRARVEPGQTYWRRWGLARLLRDRPSEDVEQMFDQQVVREGEALRTAPIDPQDRSHFRRACMSFLRRTGGTLARVERGIVDPLLEEANAGGAQ